MMQHLSFTGLSLPPRVQSQPHLFLSACNTGGGIPNHDSVGSEICPSVPSEKMMMLQISDDSEHAEDLSWKAQLALFTFIYSAVIYVTKQ